MNRVSATPCPHCGRSVPDRFRRCGYCGTVIDPTRAPEEIRRTVTVVTSDLKGSTALGERLDPESLRELLTRYFDEMRLVFESHGGTIEKIIGDAIVAVFGLPTHHDNDPLRGVVAAVESLRTLSSLNEQFQRIYGVELVNRTGIATGEVIVGEASEGSHVLTGDTVRIATVMEQNAPPSEALLAASTYEIVRDQVEVEPIGPFVPKGLEETLTAYRLVAVSAAAEASVNESRAAGAGDARTCPNCGEENLPDFVSCGTCGATLDRAAPAPERRKTVTLVFADPRPVTDAGDRPSAEALRDVMSRYFDTMRPILERHGGTVEKFIGDAVMAVYGLPVLHEDDALRAVRAALEMQEALPALNDAIKTELGVTFENHIGVNTGEVIAGDASLGQRLVTGDAVNTAARLEQAAAPHEVLLGDLTYRLARDRIEVDEVEPLILKGKAEPVPAYRLRSVATVDKAVSRRSDAPMVGREREMAALTELYERAVEQGSCELATVVGDAGVGKSRLIAEFTSGAAAYAKVIRGKCLPYGDGITFWPLREAARVAAGIGDDEGADSALSKLRATIDSEEVVDRLASVMGLSNTPYPVPEIQWGARKFLEHLAGERPVLMIVEDIHWAEPTFLELLQHLVTRVEHAPVLLLCTSRHELLDRDPDWGLADGAVRLVLRPLSDADAGLVVTALLGGTGLPEAVQQRIVDAAAGNPLFVEQLLSMLIDDGSLRKTDGHWEQVRDLAALEVPPTIQALLAARLDLLRPPERGVIEPASVIGQTFAQAAVADLVPKDTAPEVPDHLKAIVRRELITSSAGTSADETAYKFAHILVKDAAYNGLLKRARADFHERFVDWAEEANRRQGRSGEEFEEIHGYHLEQAYRYLSELGTIDEHARHVGVRASQKLSGAGRRAHARGDIPAAVSLLRRAVSTRQLHDPDRLVLLLDLADALREMGESAEAYRALDEARDGAADSGDEVIGAKARLVKLYIDVLSGQAGPDWARSMADAVERAIPIFEQAHDEDGLTLAWRQRAGMHMVANRYAEMTTSLNQVSVHARAANDRRTESRAAYNLAFALVNGPIPVSEALPRCEELARNASSDQTYGSNVNACLAELYSMQGRFDEARALIGAARAKLEDMGASVFSAGTSLNAAQIELRADDLPAAEEVLRDGFARLSALGETFLVSTVGALLARVLVVEDRRTEAEAVLSDVEPGAAEGDNDAQAILSGVHARLLALAGDGEGARTAADKAVELRRAGDQMTGLADALIDRAAVLDVLGDADASRAAWREAHGHLVKKGDVATASRIAQLLERER